MHPKDAEGIANSVDPDQTAPLVWSGSALFAQICLSENFEKLLYQNILGKFRILLMILIIFPFKWQFWDLTQFCTSST